jgi:hypothetical protein
MGGGVCLPSGLVPQAGSERLLVRDEYVEARPDSNPATLATLITVPDPALFHQHLHPGGRPVGDLLARAYLGQVGDQDFAGDAVPIVQFGGQFVEP